MAKTGYVEVRYENYKTTRHDIYYTQKHQFHIRDISNEFIAVTGFRAYQYSSKEHLIDTLREACRKYREANMQSKKVIMYYCEASTLLTMNQVSDGGFEGNLAGVSSDIKKCPFGAADASFGISYKVAMMYDDGFEKKYFEIYPISGRMSTYEVNDKRKYRVIDHTDEREAFFKNMIESMKKMVLSMSMFFGADPEVAAMLIDSSPNPLLTYSKQ